MTDTIVRGGTLVRPDGRVKADIRHVEGRIVEIAPDLKRRRPRDRRDRPARIARAHRRAPALQRAGTHRVGRARPPAAARWRPAAARCSSTCRSTRRRARSPPSGRSQSARRSKRRRSPISGCGAGSCRARSIRWRRWPSAAWSASRRSCAIRALPEFRVRRRQDAARRHARGGAARPAGGRPRRERGDDATRSLRA